MQTACRSILLTGASGNIGRKLLQYWSQKYTINGIDVDPKGDSSIVCADLSSNDGKWPFHFQGNDAVVHLAANADPLQTWESAQHNIMMDYLVLESARAAGVRRFVYGSSNHV